MINQNPYNTSLSERDTVPHDTHVRIANPWVRLCAWTLAGSLDEKLARGEHPINNPVLEARSQILTTKHSRRALADSWLNLLIEARRPYSPFGPIIPLARHRILESEGQIHRLADALVGSLPTVRGVALAITTLRDGAGPLFNPNNSLDLDRHIDDILLQLNPLTPSV